MFAAQVIFQGPVQIPLEQFFGAGLVPAFHKGLQQIIMVGIDQGIAPLAHGLGSGQFCTGFDLEDGIGDHFFMEDFLIEIPS